MSEVPIRESGARPGGDAKRGPLSSECGTCRTVEARFWPWLEPFSGKYDKRKT